jgi:thiamine biosynthesis lipoprotein
MLRAALAILVAGCAARAPLLRCESTRAAMGTTFRIVLYASDPAAGDSAARAAWARIAELEAALSDFEASSDVTRLGDAAGTGPVPIGPDLERVLARALSCAAATDGAFDPTVGPLVRLWRRMRNDRELAPRAEIAAARELVDWRRVRLDAARHSAELERARLRIDLGGIAKGDALDQALAELARRGVARALVVGGGDVAASAPPPGARGWRVAIEGLLGNAAWVELAHAALSTSGDLYRFVEIDGERYSHIVDPHVGLGLTRRTAASALHADAMTADAWATAACVLGAERALALARGVSGLELCVVELDEHGTACVHATAGFPRRSRYPGSPSVPQRGSEP